MGRRQTCNLSHKHIDQLLRELGCSRGTVPRQPGPRYERSQPNELWHIDIKGPFFIHIEGSGYLKTWIVGLVDDHSRFVLGLRIHPDAKLAPLLEWLDDCLTQPNRLRSPSGPAPHTASPHVGSRLPQHPRFATSPTLAENRHVSRLGLSHMCGGIPPSVLRIMYFLSTGRHM